MGGNLSTKHAKTIFVTPDGAIGITYAYAQEYAKHMPFEIKMPVLTPRHVALIKQNWSAICRGTNAFDSTKHGSPDKFFHRTFYSLLFAVMPSLRCIFRSSLTLQGKSLASIIKVMTGVMSTSNIVERMQTLAEGHLKFGVRKDDYTTMGVTLIRTLEVISGSIWTKEVKEAYLTAYCFLYYLLLPVIAKRAPEPAQESLPCTVSAIEVVAPNARRLTLNYDFPLRFQPGDGVLLGAGDTKRCFPIASFHTKPTHTLDIVVDLTTSDWLCRQAIGSKLRLFWIESHVNFEIDTPDSLPTNVLMVSHGIGCAPFVAMMQGLRSVRDVYNGHVVALQCADSIEDVEAFQCPQGVGDYPIHFSPQVTQAKLLEIAPSLPQFELYVTGPRDFVAQVEREYLAAGGRKRVHVYSFDKYNR
ncbi:hypothetical protein H310_04772 [Aphanomyces invadans]|uniref:FAD-binding FR-type domain-containing protein n=1 Tax=Aphanomyces invadans TaxID=157072 RepID=A0A024UCA0_9STRA|nr:hypothetical protein H310_04772 [Aphanomyces invadans]ETW03263.1 hypothetical protein H310_04772 [Aphanomyces invadans]RHY27318.1 hypothetical protein DYB32_006870 [Aphanomyces invadans]|eukprot:XP_008867492.1 hypothetical protein H310_04772 [Aphanomyces invadans]